jgi:hypothetical protein
MVGVPRMVLRWQMDGMGRVDRIDRWQGSFRLSQNLLRAPTVKP